MHNLSPPKAIIHFFLLSSFLLLQNPIKAEFIFRQCDSSTNSSTTFALNRNQLLSSLATNGARTGFYNTTAGQNPDQLYGLVLCRGDTSSQECQTCLNNGTSDLTQGCPNSKKASIWYQTCYIRYSDNDFFGTYGNDSGAITNQTEPEDTDIDARAFMIGLASKVATEPLLFGTAILSASGSRRRYGMAQCSRDLGRVECVACLGAQLSLHLKTVEGARGWQIYGKSCAMWYQAYPFTTQTLELTPTPTPTPSTQPLDGLDGSNGSIKQTPRNVAMIGGVLAVWGLFSSLLI